MWSSFLFERTNNEQSSSLSTKSYKNSEDQKVGPLHGQNLQRMLCPDQSLVQCCTNQGSQYLKGYKIIYTIISFFTVLASINTILNIMFQFKCLSYWDHNEPEPSGMKYELYLADQYA